MPLTQQEYEAKRQSRYERLIAAAERAQQAGDSATVTASAMMDRIPLGQPILVGHHSEKRDRAYRARADAKYRKGYELHKQSAALRERAAAMASNRAIFSDDPTAVEKIAEKIARLEARQELMTAANKAIRKGDDDALRALGFSDDQIHSMKNPRYAYMGQGFPAYALKNNSANIRRLKQRSKQVEAEQACATYEVTIGGVRIVDNADTMRIELYFPDKPGGDVRDELKRFGFRWAPSVGAWQRQRNNTARYWAREIVMKHYAPEKYAAEKAAQNAKLDAIRAAQDAELLAEEANA